MLETQKLTSTRMPSAASSVVMSAARVLESTAATAVSIAAAEGPATVNLGSPGSKDAVRGGLASSDSS